MYLARNECLLLIVTEKNQTHTQSRSCCPYVSTQIQRYACQTDGRSNHHSVESPQRIFCPAATSEN